MLYGRGAGNARSGGDAMTWWVYEDDPTKCVRVQRFRAVAVGVGHGPGYPSRQPRSPVRTSKPRRSR